MYRYHLVLIENTSQGHDVEETWSGRTSLCITVIADVSHWYSAVISKLEQLMQS